MMGSALLFWSALSLAAGAKPGEGIKHTPHDLSRVGGMVYKEGPSESIDQICQYCHSPHYAPGVSDMTLLSHLPLWGGGEGGGEAESESEDISLPTYSTYFSGGAVPVSGGSPSVTEAAPPVELGSVSRTCLSCHDGSFGSSIYINDSAVPVPCPQKAGISLSGCIGGRQNHHPIGFAYEDVARGGDMNPVDTPLLGANINGFTIADLLWKKRMECSSCHDVHNARNEGEKFLWVKDIFSDLCLTCHRK